jgi:hypothetical protein
MHSQSDADSMSLRRRRDPQYLELTTTKNGTFAASITRVVGAPDCVWKFADGEEQTGDSCSKVLDGSEQKVVCKIAPKYITELRANGQQLSQTRNSIRCINIINYVIWGNVALRFTLSECPRSAEYLDLFNCFLAVGDLSDLPAVVFL